LPSPWSVWIAGCQQSSGITSTTGDLTFSPTDDPEVSVDAQLAPGERDLKLVVGPAPTSAPAISSRAAPAAVDGSRPDWCDGCVAGDPIVSWLLEGDPAVRWRTLRNVAGQASAVVAAERARVAETGCGARLLAAQDPDGRWSGGEHAPRSGRPRRTPSSRSPGSGSCPVIRSASAAVHDSGSGDTAGVGARPVTSGCWASQQRSRAHGRRAGRAGARPSSRRGYRFLTAPCSARRPACRPRPSHRARCRTPEHHRSR